MTEAEWLACAEPLELFPQAERTRRTSQRVFRLFCAGFWGWYERNWKNSYLRGGTTREMLRERVEALERWAETGIPPEVLDQKIFFFDPEARAAAHSTVLLGVLWVDVVWGGPDVPVALCALVRDVFGNPFRRTKLNRAWLTSDVLALARGIYEERAFDRMPILADALQDAGCENEGVLNHCRQPGEHVRGCWVLDLVLGKS